MSKRIAGVWRYVFSRFGRLALRYPKGRVGGWLVLFLVCVAVLAPLIADDEPIVCRHGGRWHFPGFVEVVQGLPGGGRLVRKSSPFRLPTWSAKRDLDAAEFAIWPPVRFGPEEVSGDVLQPPSRRHWLGTDDVGRDVVARLVHGASASLQVAFGSMLVAGVLGVAVGAAAGYFAGWTDLILSRLIEVVMCFPVLFLVLGLMVWLEPSVTHLVLVIGLTRWTSFARYTRAEFLRQKSQDYVAGARASGAGSLRIMFRHLLPNSLAPILVCLSFGLANAILIETGLSWLGFGVPHPMASWGQLLRAAYEHLRTAPHLLYPPCVAVFLAVLGFNLLGDAVRDAADPQDDLSISRGRPV